MLKFVMMTMKAILAICVSALVSASFTSAEIVEEETWYSAAGKVVKTVKRTLTGADVRRAQSPAWEPAWVIRERGRSSRGNLTFGPVHRYFRRGCQPSRSYPYGVGFFPRGYHGGPGWHLQTEIRGRSWELSYGRPQLNLFFVR